MNKKKLIKKGWRGLKSKRETYTPSPEDQAFLERMNNMKVQGKSLSELDDTGKDVHNYAFLNTTEQGDSIWSGNIGDNEYFISRNGETGTYNYVNNYHDENGFNINEGEKVQRNQIPEYLRKLM
jgi:hypothetical protein